MERKWDRWRDEEREGELHDKLDTERYIRRRMELQTRQNQADMQIEHAAVRLGL
jgi:hypothetical protein